MLQVVTLPVGPLQSNCYIVYSQDAMEAIVVDPGEDAAKIIEVIADYKIKPTLIINTHGHGDHIGANGVIKNEYKIPLAIHPGDAPMLTDPFENLSAYMGMNITSPPADILLQDGDIRRCADNEIQVLHTPGHSPGGISLYADGFVITGDALFRLSVGRTDLPGTSHERLVQGIREKLFTLPDDTVVYPGHGPSTTIEFERRNNPFLQNA